MRFTSGVATRAATALAMAEQHPAVFEELCPDVATRAARLDQQRAAGAATGTLTGDMVSVKANIDVRGLVTTGGSPVASSTACPRSSGR